MGRKSRQLLLGPQGSAAPGAPPPLPAAPLDGALGGTACAPREGTAEPGLPRPPERVGAGPWAKVLATDTLPSFCPHSVKLAAVFLRLGPKPPALPAPQHRPPVLLAWGCCAGSPGRTGSGEGRDTGLGGAALLGNREEG